MSNQSGFANDLEWLLGFVEDAVHVGRNRTSAEEVANLVELVRGRSVRSETQHRSVRISASLARARSALMEVLEETRAPELATCHLRWGGVARESDISDAPALQSGIPLPSNFEYTRESTSPATPEIRESSRTESSQSWSDASSPQLEPRIVTMLIDLCDWYQRVVDNSIAPERALEIARRKAETLIDAIGLERIDRKGPYNELDQEIVDNVATDSEEMDMHISETVQCGYRMGHTIVRPQKVLVFRAKISGSVPA